MNLVWREARQADADVLWRWANDRETRQNSFSRSPIPYAAHVGQVRFDIADGVAEIGITVAPERRGRGYGKAMLQQAIRCLHEERGDHVRPRASVLARNEA